MRISDWSSDVCSSDLAELYHRARQQGRDPWWQRWGCRMTGSDIIGALLREHQPLINVVPLANIKAGMLPEGQPLPALLRSEERRVGKSVSVRVDLGGRRILKKKNINSVNVLNSRMIICIYTREHIQ